MGACSLYLISANEVDIFKVGISENVSARLSQLSTASPYTLKLEAAWQFETRLIARFLEKKFHFLNRRKRLSGEWFQGFVTPALVEIESMILEFWKDSLASRDAERFLISTGMDVEDARLLIQAEGLTWD